jgi:hypothetical protein
MVGKQATPGFKKTRETQTRCELSWGEAIWGQTDQPTNAKTTSEFHTEDSNVHGLVHIWMETILSKSYM